MAEFDIKSLAVPSVCTLISFLAYSSQLLFLHLEPGPLTFTELLKFNGLLLCIWICYFKACRTNPGTISPKWRSPDPSNPEKQVEEPAVGTASARWCRKCELSKPPRAHHCRICGRSVWRTPSRDFTDHSRCIPKMDHHCPWTSNCVSHFTFPHFIRFLFYAVVSMLYLEQFLYLRGAVVWNNRHMSSVCPYSQFMT